MEEWPNACHLIQVFLCECTMILKYTQTNYTIHFV